MADFDLSKLTQFSVLDAVASRIAEHQMKFGGKLPKNITLHEASYRAFFKELQERFGGHEWMVVGRAPHPITGEMLNVRVPAFAGVVIVLCQCKRPKAFDAYVDANDEAQPL